MKARLSFAVVACMFSAFTPRAAEACDCPTEPPVEVAMERSNAVVHARVTKLDDYETYRDGGTIGTTGRRTIHLAVVKAWRGEMAPGAPFDVVLDGTDCDQVFLAPGEEHVLYLQKGEKAYSVPACGRSIMLGPKGNLGERTGEREIAAIEKVVAKNQARWGASATPAASTPAPGAAAPAPAAKSGGCAGCSTIGAPSSAPRSTALLLGFAALALLAARRTKQRYG